VDFSEASIASKHEKAPCLLVIGEVLRPHGVKGEIRVRVLTDNPERFGSLDWVYVGATLDRVRVEGARVHNAYVLLKLEGYDDRAAVEPLRQALVQIPVDEALPLGQGEYFLHQIVGLGTWTVQGEYLGRVREVLVTGANDVYVVRGPKGEILLPAIEEVVRTIDLEGGRLVVEMMQGLV
jgi:16S rRNA processing protein RimM